MSANYDLVITGGRVLDPETNLDGSREELATINRDPVRRCQRNDCGKGLDDVEGRQSGTGDSELTALRVARNGKTSGRK